MKKGANTYVVQNDVATCLYTQRVKVMHEEIVKYLIECSSDCLQFCCYV